MRLAVRFSKGEPVMFVSHLDVLRLFQRAFRRAGLPLAYSQGFNPHPLVSFATALSVGFTSRSEFLDVTLTEYMPPETFVEKVRSHLPVGVDIVEAFDLGESRKSLTSAMKTASYNVHAVFGRELPEAPIRAAADELLNKEIVVMKKTKGGIKPTDIRPMVISLELIGSEGKSADFAVKGVLSAEGGLNPDMLMNELFGLLEVLGRTQIERTDIELDRELLF